MPNILLPHRDKYGRSDKVQRAGKSEREFQDGCCWTGTISMDLPVGVVKLKSPCLKLLTKTVEIAMSYTFHEVG